MEEKIYLLYNFCYNTNFTNCFDIENIKVGKINIDDIKITDETECNAILSELETGKFSFIDVNNSDLVIYMKWLSDSYPVTIKISPYYNDDKNLNNFANNDSLFSYLLSQIVLQKKSTHILLPIVNFDVDFDKVQHILKTTSIYNTINDKIQFNEISNKLSIRIREHFFKSVILKEYLSKNRCAYKPLIFQLIHTLAIIQKEFPGFRHNNLTINNIIIYIKKEPVTLNYSFENKKWEIPNIDFEIKICNFEKSILPKYYGILNQRDTDVPYIDESNEYFDVHTFLNSLLETTHLNSENNLSNCDLETKKFLDKIIPSQLRGMKNNKFYLSKNVIIEKPSAMLNDTYFSNYKYKSKEENVVNKVEVTADTNQETKNSNQEIEITSQESETINQEIENMNGKNNYLKRTIKIIPEKENKITRIQQVYKEEDDVKLYKSLIKNKDNMKGGNFKSFENPYAPEKPESFITHDTKKAEEINAPTIEKKEPDSFITHDVKKVEKVNKPPEADTRTLKPWEKTDYKPSFKPAYNPESKPSYKPREDSRPPYNPDFKPPYKPREDSRPPYNPDFKPPYKPREDSRPPYNPDFKPPYKPREDSRPPYNPDSKPPYKPREDSRPPFKPKEPEVIIPEEKFESTKTMENIDFEKAPTDVPPGFIPLYDPNGAMISKMFPYSQVPMQPSINKYYNISLSDPLGNHSYINKIYEDVLPSEKTVYSFLTVKERDVIKKFMRNSILDKYDGEDFTIQGSKKSLLSWIKIYDVNPYSLQKNPYDDIPNGFLLYRSAYPIRYNNENRSLKATPTSIAVNIRMYQISVGATRCFTLKDLDCNNFDVWRDVEYYKWVDTIIKQKISPNFINMLLYVFDTESKIGFDKLNIVKKEKDNLGFVEQNENNKKINKYALTIEDIAYGRMPDGIGVSNKTPISLLNKQYEEIKRRTLSKFLPSGKSAEDEILREADMLTASITSVKNELKDIKSSLGSSVKKPENKIDLTINDSKILVVLTEAPNTNIIKWNSKVYQSYGSVQKMIATGYHNPDVWRSILFQLIYACAVLEKNNIYFDTFSLENNIFIKDVQTDGTGKSCWIYKINNIDYYVPNYGYLLVVDSNFADIKGYKESDPIKFKIYGSIYNDINSGLTNFGKLLKAKLLNILDNTGNNFVHENGNQLDDIIKKLIVNIHSSVNSSASIIETIPNNFKEYVHNKVGTLLTKFEKENFSIFNKPSYVDGNLMIRQRRFDEYEWVIYLGVDGNKKKILTRDRTKEKETLVEESVFPSTLFSYFEKVLPEEINVIESYSFN
jgi:hypothetical protein